MKVTLKIMADMYFESDGFGGTEKNTNHVFTYLLYDEHDGIDLVEEKGEHISNLNDIQKFHLGTLILDNEIIETTDDFVTETIGNIIYINSESIELKGTISVALGYKAVLQAYWDITMESTTEISQNIELSIKRDFYGFPETNEVTDADLTSFCTGNNKKYRSNAMSTSVPAPDQIEEKLNVEFDFNLYPNPAKSIIYLEADVPESFAKVLDVNGKIIGEFDVIEHKGEFDVSNLSSGLYWVKISTPNGFKHMKFVKH
jgi:hypothetical protein